MLVYFLGGESEFARNIRQNLLQDGGDCRSFAKVGSFARAVKSRRPELVFADKAFSSESFDLRNFLQEQKVPSPIVFLDGKKSVSPHLEFLYKIKRKCKISQSLFEILKYLYYSPTAVPHEKIMADFLQDGRRLSQNSLNVSLSRLRKALAAQSDFDISLLKESGGWKLMVFQEPT